MFFFFCDDDMPVSFWYIRFGSICLFFIRIVEPHKVVIILKNLRTQSIVYQCYSRSRNSVPLLSGLLLRSIDELTPFVSVSAMACVSWASCLLATAGGGLE